MESPSRKLQVIDRVTRYIQDRRLGHGDHLPSEADMAKSLRVSRNTVREAYIAMEQNGIILRRHGIGTIVVSPSMSNAHFSVSRSFPSILQASGRKVSFRHEERRRVPAPKDAFETFKVDEKTDLFLASRLILADGEPAVYQVDHFRPDILETDLKWDQFNGDMVDLLELSFGVRDLLYQTQLKAEALPEPIASYFGVEPGTPDIVLHGVVYNHSNLKPITCMRSYHNSRVLGFTLSGTLRGTRRSQA